MKTFVYIILLLAVGIFIGNTTFKNDLFSFMKNKDSKIEKLNEEAKNTWDEITDLAKKETGTVFDMQYIDAMITMYEGSTKLSSLGGVVGTSSVKSIAKEINKEDQIKLEQLKKIKAELQKQLEEESKNKQTPPFVK